MLFTVGNKRIYDKDILSRPYPSTRKRGKDFMYDGGIVFETYNDARKFLDSEPLAIKILKESTKGYDIYGLKNVKWGKDTYKHEDGYHRLLVDAELIIIGFKVVNNGNPERQDNKRTT